MLNIMLFQEAELINGYSLKIEKKLGHIIKFPLGAIVYKLGLLSPFATGMLSYYYVYLRRKICKYIL